MGGGVIGRDVPFVDPERLVVLVLEYGSDNAIPHRVTVRIIGHVGQRFQRVHVGHDTHVAFEEKCLEGAGFRVLEMFQRGCGN